MEEKYKVEKHYCRNCEGERKHKILFEKKKTNESDDDFYFSIIEKYITIECCGCETISFLYIYADESMWNYNEYTGEPDFYENKIMYPLYLSDCKPITNEHFVPIMILHIYKETIEAIKSNCFLLAGGGFRAVIEAICKDLKIIKPTLEQKIDELNKLGHLTQNESNRLHSVRFLGNDSLHEIQKPTHKQLVVILEIINHLLNNLYIQDKIIEGSLEVQITDFDGFIKHLNKLLSNEKVNTCKTLLEILDRTKRLFKANNLELFERQLQEQISAGNYKYLKTTGNAQKGKMLYEVISIPELPPFTVF